MNQELSQILFMIIMVTAAFAAASLLIYKIEKNIKKEK